MIISALLLDVEESWIRVVTVESVATVRFVEEFNMSLASYKCLNCGHSLLHDTRNYKEPPEVHCIHCGAPMAYLSLVNETDPNGILPGEPGAKLDKGKLQASLLEDFSLALKAVATISDFGANKYSRGGWQSVPDGIIRYKDAFWRHLLAGRHEELDTDSNLPHIWHLAWNLLAVIELTERERGERNEKN